MSDLFSRDPVRWDESGRGHTGDGRVVTIEPSALTGRWVATIPPHGRDVTTRRSCKTVEEARAAVARAMLED